MDHVGLIVPGYIKPYTWNEEKFLYYLRSNAMQFGICILLRFTQKIKFDLQVTKIEVCKNKIYQIKIATLQKRVSIVDTIMLVY